MDREVRENKTKSTGLTEFLDRQGSDLGHTICSGHGWSSRACASSRELVSAGVLVCAQVLCDLWTRRARQGRHHHQTGACSHGVLDGREKSRSSRRLQHAFEKGASGNRKSISPKEARRIRSCSRRTATCGRRGRRHGLGCSPRTDVDVDEVDDLGDVLRSSGSSYFSSLDADDGGVPSPRSGRAFVLPGGGAVGGNQSASLGCVEKKRRGGRKEEGGGAREGERES